MNLVRILASLLMGLILSACETFYGPQFINATEKHIEVSSTYQNDHRVSFKIPPRTGQWSRSKDMLLQKIEITYGDTKIVYEIKNFPEIVKAVQAGSNSAIAFDGASLKLLSASEARKITSRQ